MCFGIATVLFSSRKLDCQATEQASIANSRTNLLCATMDATSLAQIRTTPAGDDETDFGLTDPPYALLTRNTFNIIISDRL